MKNANNFDSWLTWKFLLHNLNILKIYLWWRWKRGRIIANKFGKNENKWEQLKLWLMIDMKVWIAKWGQCYITWWLCRLFESELLASITSYTLSSFQQWAYGPANEDRKSIIFTSTPPWYKERMSMADRKVNYLPDVFVLDIFYLRPNRKRRNRYDKKAKQIKGWSIKSVVRNMLKQTAKKLLLYKCDAIHTVKHLINNVLPQNAMEIESDSKNINYEGVNASPLL